MWLWRAPDNGETGGPGVALYASCIHGRAHALQVLVEAGGKGAALVWAQAAAALLLASMHSHQQVVRRSLTQPLPVAFRARSDRSAAVNVVAWGGWVRQGAYQVPAPPRPFLRCSSGGCVHCLLPGYVTAWCRWSVVRGACCSCVGEWGFF